MWTCLECDAVNDDEFPECAFCGAEKTPDASMHEATSPVSPISPVTAPHAPEGGSGPTNLVLVEARTKKRVVIDHAPCVLGRMGDCCNELFSPQVSRHHLEVTRRDGTWSIAHCGSNPTTVFAKGTRTPLREGMAYPLAGGEMLRIADMTFTVELETCAVEEAELEPTGVKTLEEHTVDADVDPSVTEGWFIDCPKGGCGRSFLVAGSDCRLAECPTCVDALDKRRIARVKPVYGKRSNDVIVDLR